MSVGVRRCGLRGIAALAYLSLARSAHAEPEVAPPKQLEAEEAPYPEGGRGDALVVLELEIGRDGAVVDVKVVSGEPPFAPAARSVALRWRFSPATRGGLLIRARIRAKVAFRAAAPAALAPGAPSPGAPSADAPVTSSSVAPHHVAPSSGPQSVATGVVEIKVMGEEREELGSTHVPKSETRLVPGAFADPFRVVEVMPGVAPVVSGLPYFFVRGSPPGDVGYFVDGIRVPILFHVGPGPSVIAPALIERVDLFPAAYPARFGRYVGGVMAGETSAPSSVARGEAQARVFDASGFVEAPFADGRGSVALGGRYAYMGAILRAFAPDYGLGYGDYQARIGYALSAHDRVSVFAFGGLDRLRNEVVDRTLFDVAFHRVDLRFDHATDGGRVRVAATLGVDSALSTAEDPVVAGTQTTSKSARLRVELEERLGRGLRLRAGADASSERFSADRQARGQGAIAFAARTDAVAGAYADLVARPSSAVELVPGVRVDLARMRGEGFAFVDPRFASRVRLAQGVAWISALGLAHQLPTATVAVPGLESSAQQIAPQQAWQASEGFEIALPAKVLVKLTAFRTRALAPRAEASSSAYGAELFVRRDFTARIGGFLSYTLSRAERTEGQATQPSPYDRAHVLSAVLGFDLGRGFRAGGRLYVASGRPFRVACPTPDCGPFDPNAERPYASTGRLPAFSRVDVRVEKRWTTARGSWIAATFEWFNALLSREAEDAQWSPNGGVVPTRRGALTIPSVGVEAGY